MHNDDDRDRPERVDSDQATSPGIGFVRDEVGTELARFRRRRRRDKRKAFGLQMGVVGLAAVSTILLGFHGPDGAVSGSLANAALVCTAAVTVITAAEVFFSHRELWVLRTATVRDLEALQRKIRYYQVSERDAGHDRSQADAFYSQLANIIETDRELWERIRSRGSASTVDKHEAGDTISRPRPE